MRSRVTRILKTKWWKFYVKWEVPNIKPMILSNRTGYLNAFQLVSKQESKAFVAVKLVMLEVKPKHQPNLFTWKGCTHEVRYFLRTDRKYSFASS